MDKYIGRLLDNRYEILEVIGVGGMAVVYKARCHKLNRLVAIKILKDDYVQDEEFRRRFHAESQAVAMFSHPNIVSVYDVSTTDDADYIVMELIDGITLKQYMEKKGVLNWKETLHFAIQIGKALDHAHSRGVVHRDIKPHNVMVLKNGSVKVADFGIARVMSKSNTLTKEALGSVHYISPEQAKGGRVDSRSDIYSLGVVMYEMMTGRPPYDGESPVAVAIQHISGKASMPSTINPNIPGGLEQIIMKAMEQSPANRYATTAAMLTDMDEFRKNPSILFDYNNPNTDMDAAAKLSSMPKKTEETMPLPTSTAQRMAARAEQNKPSARSGNKPARPANRRHEEEIVEDEVRSNKAATVAIIACAAVAVVAILIFLFVMIGGGFDSQNEVVTVPHLIGENPEELNLTDVVIRLDKAYNEDQEKGLIYDQKPKAGTKIAKNGIVTVYVSLGPKPQEKIMEDLTGVSEENAIKFLVNSLGVAESNILIRTETSTEEQKGNVTRTDPEYGEPITDGAIQIWIGSGPKIQTSKVPNVVNQTAERAEALLNANGFKNVIIQHVVNNKNKGIVIYQSETAQTVIDVNTQIILQVSLGPDGEEPAPEDPPAPTVDPDLKNKVITVPIAVEMTEDYTLELWQGNELIEQRQMPVGTVSTQFSVSGKGVVTYTAKINGGSEHSWTIEVNFDE